MIIICPWHLLRMSLPTYYFASSPVIIPISRYHGSQSPLPSVNFDEDELGRAFVQVDGVIFYQTPYT